MKESSGPPCLTIDCKGKALSFPQFNTVLATGLPYSIYYTEI